MVSSGLINLTPGQWISALFFERLLKPITKKSQSMKILRQAVISRKAYQIFHQKALITFVLN
ncbi:hypothetical protein LG71_25350 [Pluralibacter gergoviae]|nr:hypothetical protein LG71_25350 [Pluralibacter gergoviae]